ncbi:MAG: efflux RND transporter permease subunit [Bryobacteraceae bacterium]
MLFALLGNVRSALIVAAVPFSLLFASVLLDLRHIQANLLSLGEPIGGIWALLVSRTHFSVSSGVGMLALLGVSVQIGVIMIEYINQLRARGHGVVEAATEGAMLRLRPIMTTMLVATLGLLPASLSHDIGSDSQRPFAIVIVGGLIVNLFISLLLRPTLYAWIARPTDRLPAAEESEGTLTQ